MADVVADHHQSESVRSGRSSSTQQRFASYVDMYRARYDRFVVGDVLKGPVGTSLILMDQPAGEYPDDPHPDLTLQLLMSDPVDAAFDLGAGRFEHRMETGSFVLTPPHTPASYRQFGPHQVLALSVPMSRLIDIFDHAKSERELGVSFRPVRETLADEIAWFRDNGLLPTTKPRAARPSATVRPLPQATEAMLVRPGTSYSIENLLVSKCLVERLSAPPQAAVSQNGVTAVAENP